MSIEAALSRVEAIRQALADPATLVRARASEAGGVAAPEASTQTSPVGSQPSFAAALAQAGGGYSGAPGAGASAGATGLAVAGPTSAVSPFALQSSGTSGAGGRIVAIAESQLGQAEQPPGSNESPAIAEYRSATAGATPGAPWCAYFASWAARQAGVPLGEGGQGLGAVSEIWSWAQSTGRAVVNGPGVVPQPGDLIVFGDEHVGIVRNVLPNGEIQTIEGNYENKVAANVRSPSEATGYVRMS